MRSFQSFQRVFRRIQILGRMIELCGHPISSLARGQDGLDVNRRLLTWHRQSEESKRMATIPGAGAISAMALAASVTDLAQFRSGREFAASLGFVPHQSSSCDKGKLGRISKPRDRYLRKFLDVGATSVVRRASTSDAPASKWAGTCQIIPSAQINPCSAGPSTNDSIHRGFPPWNHLPRARSLADKSPERTICQLARSFV